MRTLPYFPGHEIPYRFFQPFGAVDEVVALDWMGPFHDAIKPVVEKLYHSVKTGNEAQISIDSNSKPDYREKLEVELKALRESEMWQTAVTVRKLRPENN